MMPRYIIVGSNIYNNRFPLQYFSPKLDFDAPLNKGDTVYLRGVFIGEVESLRHHHDGVTGSTIAYVRLDEALFAHEGKNLRSLEGLLAPKLEKNSVVVNFKKQ